MPRRKTLTDAVIAALKPDHKPNPVPDPQLAGFYVRIGRAGRTFAAAARARVRRTQRGLPSDRRVSIPSRRRERKHEKH
jgi:hypothetical protein